MHDIYSMLTNETVLYLSPHTQHTHTQTYPMQNWAKKGKVQNSFKPKETKPKSKQNKNKNKPKISKLNQTHHKTDLTDTYRIMIAVRFAKFATVAYSFI